MKTFAQQRSYLVVAPCILLLLGLFIYWRPQPAVRKQGLSSFISPPHAPHQFDGSWDYQRDRDNLLLTQDQCDQAFPNLFADIERASQARSANPITIEELDSITPRNGYIRAMIYDQQVSRRKQTWCGGDRHADKRGSPSFMLSRKKALSGPAR